MGDDDDYTRARERLNMRAGEGKTRAGIATTERAAMIRECVSVADDGECG